MKDNEMMAGPFPLVTCKSCGHVAFEVPRKYAENEVDKFNKFWKQADAETRKSYAGPSKVTSYERCRCGGSYRQFRDAEAGDCPSGVTVNPVIKRKE